MKTGIVDAGGGLRGIYGAGIYDRCLADGVAFDACFGVSAGAGNIACFLAGQQGRDVAFYADYPFRRQYMSLWNLLTKHAYLDLDYLYKTLSRAGGENPLDYAAIRANPAEMTVVATNALDGSARYFTKDDLAQDCYDALCASSSVPVACRPYPVAGIPYYDGMLSDPVPVEKALETGCGRIVLVLTRPKTELADDQTDRVGARRVRRRYPAAAQAMRARAARYNAGVTRSLELERQGTVLILSPEGFPPMRPLQKDRAALLSLYRRGWEDAAAIADFLAK